MDRKRVEHVAAFIREKNLDALFISPSEDMVSLVGMSPFVCERFQGLVIKADGSAFYIANLVVADEMKRALGADVPVYTWWDGDDYGEKAKDAFTKEGLIGKRIGANGSAFAFHILTLMEYMDIKFVDAKDLLNESRICKDHEELDCLRKAAEYADRALEKTLKIVRPGMTEKEIQNILFGTMIELGGKEPGGLVSCGPNTSYPHYAPGENSRVLQEKDVLLFDFGCRVNGYQSDTTRTVFVGEVTEFQRKIHGIVRQANEAGEAAVFEGAYIPDIDIAARKVIEDAGYGATFTTRLGHGIGLNIHEAPEIKQSNKTYLKRGNAFSIEPGIYLAGDFGIRIEDIVVINEQGQREVLNKTSKDIIVL